MHTRCTDCLDIPHDNGQDDFVTSYITISNACFNLNQ